MRSLAVNCHFLIVIIILIVISGSCDKKATQSEEHGHELEVTLTTTPDPVPVNTPTALLFEIEENGEHVDVTMFSCEIEKEGSGNHEEMELHASDHDAGHYEGTWTFAEAGTYEVHFGFMHDEEMQEKKFTVTVQ